MSSSGSRWSGRSHGHHLAGQVADVVLHGRGYEHAIDISETTRLTGVFGRVRAPGARGSACAWTRLAVTSSRMNTKTMGPNEPWCSRPG